MHEDKELPPSSQKPFSRWTHVNYSGPERRRYTRLGCSAAMEYAVYYGDGRDPAVTGQGILQSLSPAGLGFRTAGPLPISLSTIGAESMRINCIIPDARGKVASLTGKLVRIEWGQPLPAESENQVAHVGVGLDEVLPLEEIDALISLYPHPLVSSRDKLVSLLEISHLLTSSIDLDDLLHTILATVKKLIPSEAGSLWLIDSGSEQLVFRMSIGPGSQQLKQIRLKPGQGIAGWVAEECQPLIVNDVHRDPHFFPSVDSLTGFQTRTIMAAPLRDRTRILGVIEVLNPIGVKQFGQDDLDLLVAFSAHASVAIRNAHLVSTIQEERRYLQGEIDERYRSVVGQSQVMQHAVDIARKVAKVNTTVLLLGESGVGKEIFARSIHAWSPRAHKPFRAVNCVALAEHLLESELFGYEKGAFTGAHQQKKGLLELAQGGTVFLDEIGDMKPELQAKLLRVLQDRVIDRVGGTQPIAVDVRIIAATNQDLQASVQAGRFRKDLFFRLNVVAIALPPLRERKEDIPALADLFMHRYCRDMKRAPMTLMPETLQRLKAYDWPGNIRELENVIERAVVLSQENTITPNDVLVGTPVGPLPSDTRAAETPFHDSVQAHKIELIRLAIEKTGGNKKKAADLLKLQPTYLARLCRQFSIH